MIHIFGNMREQGEQKKKEKKRDGEEETGNASVVSEEWCCQEIKGAPDQIREKNNLKNVSVQICVCWVK